MIRADKQGNLYTLSDNSGSFIIKNIPKMTGHLHVVFQGDVDVCRDFEIDGQDKVLIKLSAGDIEDIGVGSHPWYVDLTSNGEKDTIIYKKINVFEKEL